MLLKAQSVSKSFGPVKVLEDVSLQINKGDRIGIVGANGAGKSTFLKILMGMEAPDTGEITRRTNKIGYMEQFAEASENMTVREVLRKPYGMTEEIVRRMREIEEIMIAGGDIDWNALAEENAMLESQMAKFDLELEDNINKILDQVGFPRGMMDRQMSSLSGGERSKVMIARLTVQTDDCDILIMDEPTSHLDISTVEWMERSILSAGCAVVVISQAHGHADGEQQRHVVNQRAAGLHEEEAEDVRKTFGRAGRAHDGGSKRITKAHQNAADRQTGHGQHQSLAQFLQITHHK